MAIVFSCVGRLCALARIMRNRWVFQTAATTSVGVSAQSLVLLPLCRFLKFDSLSAPGKQRRPTVLIACKQPETTAPGFHARLGVEQSSNFRGGGRKIRSDLALQMAVGVMAGEHRHVRRPSGRRKARQKSLFYVSARFASRHPVAELF